MRRLALLVLAGLGLLGSECDSSGGGTPGIWLDPPVASVPVGSVLTVDVVVNAAGQPVQAFDLDVESAPGLLLLYAVEPHPEFDDDGTLFRPPGLDVGLGTAQGAADLRHGAAATGTFRVLRLRLYAVQAGTTQVALSGAGLATPSGSLFAPPPLATTVTITPP